MSRVAGIDCGTNSIRLLVADVNDDRLTDVVRRMEIVRLGAGVDRTGRLAPDALARTFDALRGYAADCDRLGAERVRMVATSASRDASNAADFLAGVVDILGVAPDVVSGSEEAALSFLGATRGMESAAMAPYLVVDIGGGSTEFILGSATARESISVDIGCVRLTERHLAADPPSPASVALAGADIDAALGRVESAVPVGEARTLIGLAGSVTTVAGIAANLPAYDPARIHHSRVSAAEVARISRSLLAADHAARAAIPVMHPGRVDVIAAGALILDRLMTRFGFAEVLVSEHDILDGIVWSVG